MELLLQLYVDFKELPLLLKAIVLAWIAYGVFKGFIKLPFINVRIKKNSCIGEACNSVAKHLKIMTIKKWTIPHRQEAMMKVKLMDILIQMERLYSTVSPSRVDVRIYAQTIKILDYQIQEMMVKWFDKNGYSGMTDREFTGYVKEKVSSLISFVSLRLDRDQELFKVKRDDILKINEKELIPYATEKFESIFLEAREISISLESDIKNIEESMGIGV